MSHAYYRGASTVVDLTALAEWPADQVTSRWRRLTDPARYHPDDGLTNAVNVAIMLGQPLLLTGEPGTGKTQLAYSVAHQLSQQEEYNFQKDVLRFDTKSTSTARDLFYSYDALRRFRDIQLGEERGAQHYVFFNALGKAILAARRQGSYENKLPAELKGNPSPLRSVVLIDEIDKAPRDFPNDLLAQLESYYFDIPELDIERIEAQGGYRPLVIITNNSEKQLPDPFLRRCIYYHLPFPDVDRLRHIVKLRLELSNEGSSRPSPGNDQLLDDATTLLGRLRESSPGLKKRPGTAEFLGWVSVLSSLAKPGGNPLRQNAELARRTLITLLKTSEDQQKGSEILEEWMREIGILQPTSP